MLKIQASSPDRTEPDIESDEDNNRSYKVFKERIQALRLFSGGMVVLL